MVEICSTIAVVSLLKFIGMLATYPLRLKQILVLVFEYSFGFEMNNPNINSFDCQKPLNCAKIMIISVYLH